MPNQGNHSITRDVDPAAPVPGGGLDTAAIEALVPSLRKIVRFGYRVPIQDVDDVVQDAVLHFLVQAEKRARAGPGLLVVITRRRCYDYWRRQTSRLRKEVEWSTLTENEVNHFIEDGDRYAEGVSDGVRIALVWHRLSERCREALARRFWKNETSAQIAQLSGDNPDSLKRMVSRCLGTLRQRLEETA
jgi:RNA polymerase sigma factor (sigma-70 family)